VRRPWLWLWLVVILSLYGGHIKTHAGRALRNSLTREDSGAGACEVIWVESLE
jgi:hypothetical protein